MAPGSRVLVVGQGYVGLPLAMRAVEVGYSVSGYDIDEARIRRLRAGHSYVEDIVDADLRGALATGRYEPTEDLTALPDFDIAVIAVPTPLRDGIPDLSAIIAAAEFIGPRLRAGCLVVLESTTYPGTTEELLADLLTSLSGLTVGYDFCLAYSPERIDPGNRDYGFATTPKIVAGVTELCLAAATEFYDSLVAKTVAVARPREAELAKLIENTYRHVNVALVNELAVFASELGVDIWAALDAAETKPFGFMRFNPGPGVGGHCLPIDPSYLSWRVRTTLGRSFRFVELANDINDHMPEYVVQRLSQGLNRFKLAVNGSQILLLGLAYKRNTSDLRESPALSVAEQLVRLGAVVHYADNHVQELDALRSGSLKGMVRVEADEGELRAADAVAILTDHDGIDYNQVAAYASYVLDTRHRCVGDSVEYL